MVISEWLKVSVDVMDQLGFFFFLLVEESRHDVANLIPFSAKRIKDLEVVNDEAKLRFEDELFLDLLIGFERVRHDGNQHIHHTDNQGERGSEEECP